MDIVVKGKKQKWKFKTVKRAKKSKLHEYALSLLKELYGSYLILEEVKIPGTRLTFDMLVPQIRLAVETNGQQHYEFNSFHHSDLLDFGRQKLRDQKKVEFCEENDITLISLKWNEQELWRTLLENV